MDNIPPDIQKAIPGVAGSLTALLFVRSDGWRRTIGTCVAGAFLAGMMGPFAAELMHTSLTVAGYVSGLFGMAIVAKIFDIIAALNASTIAHAIMKRIKG